MMMEQQKVLKSEEIQDKWKQCIKVTCCAYRVFDTLTNFYETLKEVVKRLIETLSNVWDSVVKSNLKNTHNKAQKKIPHRFYKEHYKINTFGFKPPIRQCARSRC